MRNIKTLACAAVLLVATAANAQTYKADFSTKTVFPSNGTDPSKTLTIKPGTITYNGEAPFVWTLPGDNGTGGGPYFLRNDGLGTLKWSDSLNLNNLPGGGQITILTGSGLSGGGTITLGDTLNLANTGVLSVSGTAPITAGTTDGAVTVGIDTGSLSSAGSITIGNGTGVLVTSSATADLNMGYTNKWSASQEFDGGITGATLNLNDTGAYITNLDHTGPGGTNYIGNNGPVDSSTTYLSGNVIFNGTVTLPAGAVSSSSLGLAQNDIFIGNGSGNADSASVTQDVSFVNSGSHVVTATVDSSHASTFVVVHDQTIAGKLGFGVTPGNTITNTNDNLLDHWSDGERPASIAWEMNSDGYVAAFSNAKVASGEEDSHDNNGLLVKIADNASTDIAFDVASGAPDSVATDLMHVDGAGNVVIDPSNNAITSMGGQTNVGSLALSAATAVDVAAGGVITIGNSNSFIPLTTSAAPAGPVTGFTGENANAGQILTFSNVGTNPITLQSNGSFALNGADVIMGPNGSVTLMYNGTNWILIGAE